MIYLALPTGTRHGWGVCGKYITQELSRLAPVTLYTDPFTATSVGDELDYDALARVTAPAGEWARLASAPADVQLPGPLLTAVQDLAMNPLPFAEKLRGTRTVGYTFFENSRLPADALTKAARYDHLAAGSTTCAERLVAAGLPSVSTVIQGIDPTVFCPAPVERRYFRDQFVIFSGGKLELRKGQDVVVRAVQLLQAKYRDVLLVTAWNNPWPATARSMAMSRLTRFAPTTDDPVKMVEEYLALNGIDLRRTVNLPPRPNTTMARVYKQTDVGLFPNRCEGGTNLVLMEYMACGKPAIASFSSGHRDILTAENSLPLRQLTPVALQQGNETVAVWDEPQLDEVVAALEFAYLHRDRLLPLARRAGEDLQQRTWRHTAQDFLKLLTST
jgi:glycosyltransferase involved in cell wall biosynthesis